MSVAQFDALYLVDEGSASELVRGWRFVMNVR